MATYFAERFDGQAAPATEILADAFVEAYGNTDTSSRHTYYLDKFDLEVSDDDISSVKAAVWLCVELNRDIYPNGERGIQTAEDKSPIAEGIGELGLVSKPNLSHPLASMLALTPSHSHPHTHPHQ